MRAVSGRAGVDLGGFDEWMGAWSPDTPRDPGGLAHFQLNRAWGVVETVARTNPFYGRRLDMPSGRDPDAYRSLPLTVKQEVVDDCAEHPPYGSRTVSPPEAIRMVVHTSGTSGQGMAVYALDTADLDAIIRTEAVGFLWAGVGEGTRVLLTLPIGMTAAGLWYSAALRAVGANLLSVGPYSTERKVELLRQARCLVFPIQWEEPFGLVMIEAMLVGTPVVAFACGAAPEVVDDGVTGFLVHTFDELCSRLRDVGRIDRKACRARARRRWSSARMARAYADLYREMAAHYRAARGEHTFLSRGDNGAALSAWRR